MNIDLDSEEYVEEVRKSISSFGKKVDFFTKVKAHKLVEIAHHLIGDTHNLKALDVGCGIGLTDKLIQDAFGHLSGVDVSERAIENARINNPEVDYTTCDGIKLPYADGSFDLSFAINVMHHIQPEAWDAFVAEMVRVTNSEGLVVIFEHNPWNPLTRLAVFRCSFDEDAVLLTGNRMKSIFSANRLTVVEKKYILFFPSTASILQSVERRLGGCPFGAQYYVVGRKVDN